MQPFRFKQFSIAHDRCAHKVGTDGVLLGAWVKAENPQAILDAGTGSGVIALMLAQRFPGAMVTGIELDESSADQARENTANSPFADRVTIIQGDFLNYSFQQKFDLIVSNPPFFKGNTSTGKLERDKARHEEHLPQKDFIQKAASLLSPEGKLAMILPKEEGIEFLKTCSENPIPLHPHLHTRVYGSPSAPEKRWLLELGFEKNECRIDSLMLRDEQGNFSSHYRELTKDFYLNF